MTSDGGPIDADARFQTIAGRFLDHPAVTTGTGFGTNPGLRVRGKIFAMVVRGGLVVKLPRERVAELVAAGTGTPFEAGRGRPMREWVSVPVEHANLWEPLVAEAFQFVGEGA